MAIDPNIVAEGQRVLAEAGAHGLPLRLLGGVAVRLRAGDRYPRELERRYHDLDFVTSREGGKVAEDFFRGLGYEPYHAFNVLHGDKRQLFFDTAHDRHVDVFVGEFSMCHVIPLEERLAVDEVTVPLAELLLTKLQIVELNEKDVRDTLALLLVHDVGEADGETLNAGRVAELCAGDWGLWRTITGNLAVSLGQFHRYELEPERRSDAERRIERLLGRIDDEPKSRAWRLRARIGERKRWYDLPEEVGTDV